LYEDEKELLVKRLTKEHAIIEILGVDLHTKFEGEELKSYYDKWYLK
tara:strand:- start:513 stop:653 length:141 start_codon:yes stop_codon:yes gene_type:complete